MGENVIFEGTPTNDQPDTGQTEVPQVPTSPGDIPPQDGSGEGEPPIDDGGSEIIDAPPPEGIRGILASNLFKKILIALGIIIILIIIVILIMPKQPAGKKVTLVWWGLWEDITSMQPLIDEFEKQNPNIKIQYIKQDPEKYRDTLMARISNNVGPDIFRYHNTWTPVLSSVLAPLPKDVIKSDDFQKAYYPVIQKDLTQNGAIYGIPLGIDSLALFVNTDLLKAAGVSIPKDWNQFADAVKKMTVKDKNKKIQTSGAALGTYGNIMHAPDILSMMFLQQGADLKKISLENDNLTAALTFYTSFAKGRDNVWDNSLDNSQIVFARGELAMYFGFSWDIFTIEKLKTNKNLKYEIHPVPGLVGGQNITVASYWVEGVSSRSKNQKEAMQFMRYLTQKNTLQKLYTEASKTRLFGELYPRVDMADELKDNPLVYPFISQLKTAESSYFASDTHDGDTGINKRANKYLENAVNSIINDNSSAESQVSGIKKGVGVILKENGIQ